MWVDSKIESVVLANCSKRLTSIRLKDPIQKNDSIVHEFETAALNKLNYFFFQIQRQIGCMSELKYSVDLIQAVHNDTQKHYAK